MKLPEINLKELEKIRKKNFRERLEFQDKYMKWMKMSSNFKWSTAQKALINHESGDSIRRSNHSTSATHRRHARGHLKN